MLAAAQKDEKKDQALKNHVGHPQTGRDCPFTLLNSPISHTQYPYVTGTSVLGIKYKDGVLLASDMGGSYGSTLRYKSVQRLKPIGKHTLLGAGGEISDFQEIVRYLDELILYDNMWDDGNSLGPKEVHNYLNRLMYNRRNKFNPLWNTLVLGGVKNGQKYLGTVNMIGVHYEENHVATGFGNHLARPIFRDEWHEDMTFEEGVKLLEKCMLVLLYRDRSAVNKLQGGQNSCIIDTMMWSLKFQQYLVQDLYPHLDSDRNNPKNVATILEYRSDWMWIFDQQNWLAFTRQFPRSSSPTAMAGF